MVQAPKRVVPFAKRALLALGSFLVATVVCEAGVRWLLPTLNQYLILPARMHMVFRPRPEAMQGVEGSSRFITNAFGVRGDELAENQRYRILTVGGSTTECLYLDQSEAWPAVLEQRLNTLGWGRVWVGNVGSTGKHTRDHVLHLKYFVPRLPGIDAVILLVGVNDVMLRLRDPAYQPMTWGPATEAAQMGHAFYFSPYRTSAWSYQQTALWRILRQLKYVYIRRHAVLDGAGQFYVTRRLKRQRAVNTISTLPDLTTALAEYRQNLHQIIDTARAQSIRPIFLTQPLLWKAGLTPEEERLLWGLEMPGTGAYYTVDVLAEAMQRYNDTLLEVCRARHVECIDLARQLPLNGRIFFDDMHFTEVGARQVAASIFEYLRDHPLAASTPATDS